MDEDLWLNAVKVNFLTEFGFVERTKFCKKRPLTVRKIVLSKELLSTQKKISLDNPNPQ